MLLYFISNVPIFFFLLLVEKRIDLVLSSQKWMLNFLLINQSHILQKLIVSSLFIWSRSLCWYSNHTSSVYGNRSQSTTCGISSIYRKKNKGPRMDPCGTPHLNSAVVENVSWTFTWNFLLRRYDLNQSITSFENPVFAVKYNDLYYQMLFEGLLKSFQLKDQS